MSLPLGYALVTGASSGIGLEVARELARRRYPLVLVARRVDRLEALRVELANRVDVVVIAADLATAAGAQALYDDVRARGLRVDILVNNAGAGMQGRFLQMDLAAVTAMFQLNVLSLMTLTQRFGADMVARGGGHILQVASAAAFLPSPHVSAYAASKAAVMSFSEALRFELRGTGVSVTTLYPGITTTEFNEVAHARTPRLMDLSILSSAAVARVGVSAMFRGRRAVVPGWINRANAFLSQVLHRGLITFAAGWLLERANRPPPTDVRRS